MSPYTHIVSESACAVMAIYLIDQHKNALNFKIYGSHLIKRLAQMNTPNVAHSPVALNDRSDFLCRDRFITRRVLILAIGICMFMGTCINVSIAALCVMMAQAKPDMPVSLTTDDIEYFTGQYPFENYGAMAHNWGGCTKQFGYTESMIGTTFQLKGFPAPSEPDGTFTTISEIKAGWPFYSLRHNEVQMMNGKVWVQQYSFMYGTPRVLSSITGQFTFPRYIIWSGFVLNSILFAVVLAIMMVSVRSSYWLLRQRRQKRGLCVACGYPLGLSDICSECGQVRQEIASSLR